MILLAIGLCVLCLARRSPIVSVGAARPGADRAARPNRARERQVRSPRAPGPQGRAPGPQPRPGSPRPNPIQERLERMAPAGSPGSPVPAAAPSPGGASSPGGGGGGSSELPELDEDEELDDEDLDDEDLDDEDDEEEGDEP